MSYPDSLFTQKTQSRASRYPGPSTRAPPGSLASSGLPGDRDIMQGLLPNVAQTIAKPSVSPTDQDVKILGLTYIGSFNWVDATTPTIMVPGSPPEWLNRKTPYRVNSDSGICFVDQNSYKLPSMTFLSLMKAVDVHDDEGAKADIDWPSVDFVTDRNGLRKLLRWIGGHPDNTREFRIDTQLAGKRTVLFNRWEKRYREARFPHAYGYNFEEISTRPAPGCSEATGYHRIVTYDLDGLKMIVRFEVDACLPPARPAERKSVGIDELTSTLSGMNLSSTSTSVTSIDSGTPHLKILRGGSLVPQTHLIELTTLSERRRAAFEWSELFGQMFLSQTPLLFMGIHRSGLFDRIERRVLGTSDFADAERKAQENLKALRKALAAIQKVVVASGQRGRLSLVCRNGEMKVYSRSSSEECLPGAIMKRFDV